MKRQITLALVGFLAGWFTGETLKQQGPHILTHKPKGVSLFYFPSGHHWEVFFPRVAGSNTEGETFYTTNLTFHIP